MTGDNSQDCPDLAQKIAATMLALDFLSHQPPSVRNSRLIADLSITLERLNARYERDCVKKPPRPS
jgi:VanZ family protein